MFGHFKKNLFQIVLIGIAQFPWTAQSATVAHWRFEEGPPATGVAIQSDVVLDSSGNGNHLRTHAAWTAPTYLTDRPFHPVPRSGDPNHLALHFTGSRDLFTLSKPIESKRFSAWTIEVSFKPHAANEYQVILGKDGNPLGWGPPPVFFKKLKNSRRLEVGLVDGSGVFRSIVSLQALQADQWYNAAATATPSELTLWLKAPGDSNYVLQDRIAIAGAFQIPPNGFAKPWTIGRGMWDGELADWFDGVVDEVRVSNTALDPGEFLAANHPALDPAKINATAEITSRMEDGETRRYLAVEAAKPAPSISFRLQSSPDLLDWAEASFALEPVEAGDGELERLRLVSSIRVDDHSSYFLRPNLVHANVAEPETSNPIIDGADPDVLRVGDAVWVYPTHRGDERRFFAYSSSDLMNWRVHGPVFEFADVDWIPQGKHAWAPGIAEKGGMFYLYYSAGPKPSHIGVAVADSPAGPFTDSGQPLLSDNGDPGFEAIDAMVFTDPVSGESFLYAGGSAGATLRVFELNADMISFAREIAVETPEYFTEGAFMHYREGIYYLSYSHGSWSNETYSVHYAVSLTPTGPWSYQGPILSSDSNHKGPGHHSIVHHAAEDRWYIFYHRWNDAEGPGPYEGQRKTAVDILQYDQVGRIQSVNMTDTGVGPVEF